MPDYKQKQFYKEDYGTMMDKYEKHLQFNEKMQEKKVTNVEWQKKKAKLVKWTEADQLFEDALWAS